MRSVFFALVALLAEISWWALLGADKNVNSENKLIPASCFVWIKLSSKWSLTRFYGCQPRRSPPNTTLQLGLKLRLLKLSYTKCRLDSASTGRQRPPPNLNTAWNILPSFRRWLCFQVILLKSPISTLKQCDCILLAIQYFHAVRRDSVRFNLRCHRFCFITVRDDSPVRFRPAKTFSLAYRLYLLKWADTALPFGIPVVHLQIPATTVVCNSQCNLAWLLTRIRENPSGQANTITCKAKRGRRYNPQRFHRATSYGIVQ